MKLDDLLALSPIIALYAAAIVVLLWIAMSRSRAGTQLLSTLGVISALCLLPVAAAQAPREVTALIILDGYSLFYIGLILIAALVVTLLSIQYFDCHESQCGEFFVLLLLSTSGACTMVASKHLASFYLGLEILSISLYAMIGYTRQSIRGTEAAMKYLILAAAAAALFLFGMALVYAELGTLDFSRIAAASIPQADNGVLLLGFAMVLAGIGFKLSVVPFHLWTPDVYQGAPAPVTAFLSTVSKAAVFAVMLRHFAARGNDVFGTVFAAFAVVAVASMFVGNFLALRQDNIKRMLAYSSISHIGYMGLAFLGTRDDALISGAVYLATYFAASLAALGVVSLLSTESAGREADTTTDYTGLLWRRPLHGIVLMLAMLSLAGVPLTAGFIGKLYLVKAGVGAQQWLLLVMLIINSGIGLYYYLRFVQVVCRPLNESSGSPAWTKPTPMLARFVLTALTLAILWIGIYPTTLINAITATVLSSR